MLSTMKQIGTIAKVLRGDGEHGLVIGWAIVSKENGEPYYDLQGSYIPEEVMLAGAVDFAKGARPTKVMHDGEPVGQAVFLFPLTADIAKAFGFPSDKTGLMVAMKPDSEAVLQKYESGEYRGFSIGGRMLEVEWEDKANA